MTRDELVDAIEARILAGDLPAGAKLPSERQLADRFGVSRPIVREVLRTLAERNLIDVLPARGSFIRDPRVTDAAGTLDLHYRRSQATPRDLVEARTMLESTAAEVAAARSNPDDIEAIDDAIATFDRATTVIERVHADLAFHFAIARASHNPVIETMFGSIANLTLNLMLRSLSDAEVTRESIPFHREIRDALHRHDPQRAGDAMRAHLAVAARLYGDDYERTIDSVMRRQLTVVAPADLDFDALLSTATAANGVRRHDG